MNQLHLLVFTIIHALFSVYVRFRQAWNAVKDRTSAILYYHHRTPELIQKDVRALSRLPTHLSVVLKLDSTAKGGASLEALVDEAAEITAWCACAGIPMLSIYERSGRYSLFHAEQILIQRRNLKGLCATDSYGHGEKTLRIFWARASCHLITSTTHSRHRIL